MGNNRGLTKRTQCGEIFYDGMSMWDKSRRIRKSDKINFYQDILSSSRLSFCLFNVWIKSMAALKEVYFISTYNNFGYPTLR